MHSLEAVFELVSRNETKDLNALSQATNLEFDPIFDIRNKTTTSWENPARCLPLSEGKDTSFMSYEST